MRRTDTCVMDAENGTKCKRCRLEKCLKIGMRREKVDKKRGWVKETAQIFVEVDEFRDVTQIHILPVMMGGGEVKKWVGKPLDRQCGVCESPAPMVLHFGAVCCYSCRLEEAIQIVE